MISFRFLSSASALAIFASAISMPANAEGVSINTLVDHYESRSVDPDFFKHNHYRAQDTVRSGEYIGAMAMQKLEGHIGSNMPLRFGAEIANVMYQSANAIIFGHEYQHFALHDHFGADVHWLSNSDREEISLGRAYFNTFFMGAPGGPAISSGGHDPHIDPNLEIMATTAGNNWQMSYSEDWVQRNMRSGGSLYYSWPGFFVNRTKTLFYTLGDRSSEDPAGDMSKISAHYDALGYSDASIDEIAKYALVANVLSPTFWKVYSAMNGNGIEVDVDGNKRLGDPFYNVGGVRFNWDVPQYLNADGMTLAPVAYFDLGPVVLGTQLETAVIGESEDELTLIMLADYRDAYGSISYTVSDSEGTHVEATLGYDFHPNMGFEIRHASSDGETLRGFRNNYSGEDLTYAGINIRF